jgi:hypothetical protein
VLAVLCHLECDEVRCGRPINGSSSEYYKCPHGIEYARVDIDATAAEDYIGHSDSALKKKNVALKQKVQPSTAVSAWARRIRFLTVEGASEYVKCIGMTKNKIAFKIEHLPPPEFRELLRFDNLCSAVLWTDEDLSCMLKYWQPEALTGHRRKATCLTIPNFTPVRWHIQLQYQLPILPALCTSITKWLTESVLSDLKQRIAKREVQIFCK